MQLREKSLIILQKVDPVISLHSVSDLERRQMWISNDMLRRPAYQFQSRSNFELADSVASTWDPKKTVIKTYDDTKYSV